jgi:N-acetylneuraminate synthase
MHDLFGCQVGLSDHTLGMGVAIASIALGATVIEKHFTLSRADGGVDADFSLEPQELQALVAETERAWYSLGTVRYGPSSAELGSLAFRRSVFAIRSIRAGEPFTPENVRVLRPNTGLAPKYLAQVLDGVAATDVASGTPIAWRHVRSKADN